jgi:hypothetical protein
MRFSLQCVSLDSGLMGYCAITEEHAAPIFRVSIQRKNYTEQ